jgi:hypothetical protein
VNLMTIRRDPPNKNWHMTTLMGGMHLRNLPHGAAG